MGLFDKLRRALGFGPDDDEYVDDRPDIPAPAVETPAAAPAADAEIAADPRMVRMIFDKVVEVTNSAVPAYLASGINPEQQKQYLYDALDVSMKGYIASLERAANDKCRALWQEERDKLQRETDSLKQRARDLEAKRSEMTDQNLSIERQKRALAERVHDLESKLMKLESEKEQLELEKHSLLNKVKVAGVHSADAEQLRQQLAELQEAGASPEALAEINDLKSQLAARDDQVDSLSRQIDDLNSSIDSLRQAAEAAKVKDAMGTTMLNDLQKRAADSLSAAQEAQQQVLELSAEVARKDARIADLTQAVADRDARIADDQETIDGIQQIIDQLDQFEAVKRRYEDRVAQLRDQLREAQRDNDTLRTTIKNNLYAHAQEQKLLHDQIDALRAAR